MRSRPQLQSAIAAAGLLLVAAWPARAADPDLDKFKSEIDAFVAHIAADTNGAVKWAGSDPYEIRHDGGSLVAVVSHVRLALGMPEAGHIALDRVEIRRTGEEDGGKLVDLDIRLPSEVTLVGGQDGEVRIALKDATAKTVVEAATGRNRNTRVAAAGGRIEAPKLGSWLGFGPVTLTAQLVPETGGGWSAPFAAELRKIEFFSPQDKTPVAGTIDRVWLSGKSAGPDLASFDKLRDALDALKKDTDAPPEARLAGFWALLPSMPAAFSAMQGDAGLEGLTVREGGEPLVTLAKAGIAGEITGLNGEETSLRLTFGHDGLELARSLLEPDRVPRHVVVDIGVEHVGTKALLNLIAAASAMGGKAPDGDKRQQATQQLLGAAAMLDPTYRVYHAVLDTRDVGVDLKGEAMGSPLAPKGYSAAADLQVRGLDAVAPLAADPSLTAYLPVLQEIAVAGKAPDGTPRAEFHIASAPGKLITVNGNDIALWFDGSEPPPGEGRLLRPADPPLKGGDVKAVQRALAAAHIAAEQNGVYNAATAAAVARFQKQNGLNVDGVVDAATRKRLGLAGAPARQRGRN